MNYRTIHNLALIHKCVDNTTCNLHRITVTVLIAFGYYIYLNYVDYQRSVINTYVY